jgi:hypothetical protein
MSRTSDPEYPSFPSKYSGTVARRRLSDVRASTYIGSSRIHCSTTPDTEESLQVCCLSSKFSLTNHLQVLVRRHPAVYHMQTLDSSTNHRYIPRYIVDALAIQSGPSQRGLTRQIAVASSSPSKTRQARKLFHLNLRVSGMETMHAASTKIRMTKRTLEFQG